VSENPGQVGHTEESAGAGGSWKQIATRPEPYDPLKLENLARSIEIKLLEMEPAHISGLHPMFGAGIYAIYYVGDHELYKPIADGRTTPIYVGKAVYPGGRKGLAAREDDLAPLWKRIDEHRVSLACAGDLDVDDFRVRYLVAVDFFVSLAEQLMIRQFRPVWNTLVDGFGNHAPGGNRADGARPPWDELHPGRPWSTPERMPKPSKQSAERSSELIHAHWVQQGLLPEDEGP